MPTLSVTLLRAHDLPASDLEIVAGGKSDPYVVFSLGAQQQRSTTLKNALSPVWHPAEKFEFDVHHVRKDVLKIEVFDRDTWDRDDLLASLALPVSRFEAQADKTVAETLALEVPGNFASQHRKSAIHLEFCLALQTGNDSVLQIWECERYSPTRGWGPSDAKERLQWCAYDESSTSNSFEDVAPPVPPHLEGKGWGYTAKHGDAQGWMYATTWSGPWSASGGTLMFVRRRLWENVCEPAGSGTQSF